MVSLFRNSRSTYRRRSTPTRSTVSKSRTSKTRPSTPKSTDNYLRQFRRVSNHDRGIRHTQSVHIECEIWRVSRNCFSRVTRVRPLCVVVNTYGYLPDRIETIRPCPVVRYGDYKKVFFSVSSRARTIYQYSLYRLPGRKRSP